MKGGESVLMVTLGTLREYSEDTTKWLLNSLKHEWHVPSPSSAVMFGTYAGLHSSIELTHLESSPSGRQGHCTKRSPLPPQSLRVIYTFKEDKVDPPRSLTKMILLILSWTSEATKARNGTQLPRFNPTVWCKFQPFRNFLCAFYYKVQTVSEMGWRNGLVGKSLPPSLTTRVQSQDPLGKMRESTAAASYPLTSTYTSAPLPVNKCLK